MKVSPRPGAIATSLRWKRTAGNRGGVADTFAAQIEISYIDSWPMASQAYRSIRAVSSDAMAARRVNATAGTFYGDHGGPGSEGLLLVTRENGQLFLTVIACDVTDARRRKRDFAARIPYTISVKLPESPGRFPGGPSECYLPSMLATRTTVFLAFSVVKN